MRQTPLPRIGSKLRSLLARVVQRCGLDKGKTTHRHRRSRRSTFNGVQPLEPRQLLSVAIQMVPIGVGSPSNYVMSGTDVYASPADSFTVGLYVTYEGGDTDTLASYQLNFVDTDNAITFSEWVRNTTLYPDNSGDVFGFYDDEINLDANNQYVVSGALLDATLFTSSDQVEYQTGLFGWYLGYVDLALPSEVGDYQLTLSTADADNPTYLFQQYSPDIQTTPVVNGLTFHVVDAATVTIESLPTLTDDIDGEFTSIDITTTYIDTAEFSLSDLQLERDGNIIISDTDVNTDNDWEDFAGLSLTDANIDGVYQLVGLNDVIDLSDGTYTLTVLAAGVTNTAGITLLTDQTATFTVDTEAPQVTIDNQTTSDSTPTLTGTINDITLDTFSITITHKDDSFFASQTFTLANGDIQIDGNNWTLNGSLISMLEGGSYNILLNATDQLDGVGIVTHNTSSLQEDVLIIIDADEPDDSFETATAMTTSREYHLSIHENGDADWKSLTLGSTTNLLVLGNVISGDEMTVKIYLYNEQGASLPETPNYTFTSTAGVLNETINSLAAGTYYFEITSTGMIYNYNFVAGDEGSLSNTVSGTVVNDLDFDGVADGGETGYEGLTVYLDEDGSGTLNGDEVFTTTQADGSYIFNDVISGTYQIRLDLPPAGIFQTTEQVFLAITPDGGEIVDNQDLFVRDITVEGRYLFYNNSAFDKASSGFEDSDAIATNITALLPGSAASTSNVSSYSRGINGIMLDVAGLQSSTLTTDDFLFRVGNDNDPDGWTQAAAPASIEVLAGQGVDGTDRIVLIWDDGDITKTWLEVQLQATGNTGLSELDSFFFGNAVGDSKNSTVDFNVNASDRIAARDNASGLNTVGIDSNYDFNRDGLVNASDRIVARDNATGFNPINKIDLTGYTPGVSILSFSALPSVASQMRAQPSQIDQLALALASSPSKVHLTMVGHTSDNQADETQSFMDLFINS